MDVTPRSRQITAMANVLDAQLSLAQSNLQKSREQELRITKLLDHLASEAAHRVHTSDDVARFSVGAGAAWRSWALNRRVQLNSQLALVRAKREHAQETARRAFAKRDALRAVEKHYVDQYRQEYLRALERTLSEQLTFADYSSVGM